MFSNPFGNYLSLKWYGEILKMFHYRSVAQFCAISARLFIVRGDICAFRFSTVRSMSRVLIRKVDSEERMQISLKYVFGVEPTRVRQFNFDRLQTEEVEKTLIRIQGNISKLLVEKAMKKRKKKPNAAEARSDLIANDNVVEVSLLDGSGNKIDGKLLNDVAWTTASRLSIESVDYKILVNPPSVVKLALPKCILVGFAIQPKMDAEFINLDMCDFIWYREEKSKSDGNWTMIHKGFSYLPCSDDEGLRYV